MLSLRMCPKPHILRITKHLINSLLNISASVVLRVRKSNPIHYITTQAVISIINPLANLVHLWTCPKPHILITTLYNIRHGCVDTRGPPWTCPQTTFLLNRAHKHHHECLTETLRHISKTDPIHYVRALKSLRTLRYSAQT